MRQNVMNQSEKFLFTLLYKSASRGRHYVLCQSDLGKLADKWVLELAQVDAPKCEQGLHSADDSLRMINAALALGKLLLYMLQDDEVPTAWQN